MLLAHINTLSEPNNNGQGSETDTLFVRRHPQSSMQDQQGRGRRCPRSATAAAVAAVCALHACQPCTARLTRSALPCDFPDEPKFPERPVCPPTTLTEADARRLAWRCVPPSTVDQLCRLPEQSRITALFVGNIEATNDDACLPLPLVCIAVPTAGICTLFWYRELTLSIDCYQCGYCIWLAGDPMRGLQSQLTGIPPGPTNASVVSYSSIELEQD